MNNTEAKTEAEQLHYYGAGFDCFSINTRSLAVSHPNIYSVLSAIMVDLVSLLS